MYVVFVLVSLDSYSVVVDFVYFFLAQLSNEKKKNFRLLLNYAFKDKIQKF